MRVRLVPSPLPIAPNERSAKVFAADIAPNPTPKKPKKSPNANDANEPIQETKKPKPTKRTTHPTRVPPPPLRPCPLAPARTRRRDEAPCSLPLSCAHLSLHALLIVVVGLQVLHAMHGVVHRVVAVHGGLDGLGLIRVLVLVLVFVLRGVMLVLLLVLVPVLLLEMPLVLLVPSLLLPEILLPLLLLLL